MIKPKGVQEEREEEEEQEAMQPNQGVNSMLLVLDRWLIMT